MKKIAAALVLMLAALALVACGGSSGSSETTGETTAPQESESEAGGGASEGSGSASTLKIEASSSELAYTTTSATAKAGNVTVDFTNPSAIGHDVAIESSGGETVGKTEIVTEGSGSASVNLKPGTYKFFCTVPGHREAGMEGTLTVK
jgi:plastocyanin